MKTMKTKSKIYKGLITAVVLNALIVFTLSGAPPEEFNKKITKSFTINRDALLRLDSKYGRVNIKNWDQNKINFEVTIEVEADSREKAEDIFNSVTINLKGSPSLVEAQTIYQEKVFGLISKKNNKLNVIYEISAPESISLQLSHKYGEVNVDDINGKTSIDVSYGSLHAGDLANSTNDLNIGYAKSSVGEFGGGTIDIKYSTLELDESKDVTIDSKYSTITIGEADNLMLDSGYDHIRIDELETLSLKSQFSGIEIEELKKGMEIDITYGNFEIDEVSSGFNELVIKNAYANVSLGVDEEASYMIDAEFKYGGFSFPSNHEYLSKQIISTSSSVYEGRIGKDESPKSKITIDSKHAKVTIHN